MITTWSDSVWMYTVQFVIDSFKIETIRKNTSEYELQGRMGFNRET